MTILPPPEGGSPRQHPTLFELRAGQCRFPVGGPVEPARFFCGEPALPGRPYCQTCCERAYVVMRPQEPGAGLRKQG